MGICKGGLSRGREEGVVEVLAKSNVEKVVVAYNAYSGYDRHEYFPLAMGKGCF